MNTYFIARINNNNPINLDYFLSMKLQPGGGGKEIIHVNTTLRTVKDVVEYWSNSENIKNIQSYLNESNWQYFNNMMSGFRYNVANHHELGWANMTKEYFEGLIPMSDNEIVETLKNNPIDFGNGYVKHGYHRACAMIGRLIRGESYIPFWMNTETIYDVPRYDDGKHRITSPILNVQNITEPLTVGIPNSAFIIAQSGILALMGIRQNDDLDIIVSDTYKDTASSLKTVSIDNTKFEKRIGKNAQDIISEESISIMGVNFMKPKWYFPFKHKSRTHRDISDWKGIQRFFEMKGYEGYPFNLFEYEDWGFPWG